MTEAKHEILYRELKQLIVEMRSGEKFLTSREIMKRFKVSQLIVDKAKALLTEDGLISSQHGKGTFVSPSVSKHKKKGCERITFAMPNWPSPFTREITEHITSNYQKDDGVYIDINFFDYKDGISTELCSGSEGLILFPALQKVSPEQLMKLSNLEVPYITWSRILQNVAVDNIYCDSVSGPIMAAEHLVKLGHRKIAILETEPPSREESNKLEAFSSYAKLQGATVDLIDCGTKSGELATIKAYQKMEELILAETLDYTAIFVVNDTSALGALNALSNNNIKVPEDISIIGYGGLNIGAYYHPKLTTIDTKVLDQFDFIVEQLLNKIRGISSTVETSEITPELLIRESTQKINTT